MAAIIVSRKAAVQCHQKTQTVFYLFYFFPEQLMEGSWTTVDSCSSVHLASNSFLENYEIITKSLRADLQRTFCRLMDGSTRRCIECKEEEEKSHWCWQEQVSCVCMSMLRCVPPFRIHDISHCLWPCLTACDGSGYQWISEKVKPFS